MEASRKKSPRAPSMGLEEALARALAAYDKDRTHPAPTEVVAQHLGYKSANNGSALAAIASLRYYGLLERPKEGMLAVSKAVETYKFTPDESHRSALLVKFLRTPQLFDELLQQYKSALPSDATIRYELITRGFLPGPAEVCAAVFRKSVEFAGYFNTVANGEGEDIPPSSGLNTEHDEGLSRAGVSKEDLNQNATQRQQIGVQHPATVPSSSGLGSATGAAVSNNPALSSPSGMTGLVGGPPGEGDSIPIRLSGGRKAWLVVPDQLFEADKVRLKAQIDLLLTVEQEQSME